MENKKVLVIDGNSFIFRGYYATARKGEDGWKSTLHNSKGEATNALRVFGSFIHSILKKFDPEYIMVAFDSPVKTYRHENTFYKATRKSTPEDLKTQFAKVKEFLDAHSIMWSEVEGLEADDILGSISKKLSANKKYTDNFTTYIATGDRDMFQLIDENTAVYYPNSKTKDYDEYNLEFFTKKFPGLEPMQLVEIKALTGEASDNLPGVKGIGKVTAEKLIKSFGSIDGIYKAIDDNNPEIKGLVLSKLVEDKDNAYLTRDLATIITDAKLPFTFSEIKYNSYNSDKLRDYLNSEDLFKLLDTYGL